jgi:1-acyl-sn-glycerol-3-phosphate acyltransferase
VRQLLWRLSFYVWALPVVRTLVRVRREGPRLPRGPILLAPNHCSFMDPVVVQATAWRNISFMMTEVFYRPWPGRWFFALTGAIPVNEGRGNRGALGAAIDALKQGRAVAVFPEGRIARDGMLQRFHPGVAAIAEATGATVVPVGIAGTYEAFPRHARFPRLFSRVTVRYGAPIPPPKGVGAEGSRKEMLRAYTERVRDACASLLPPSQVPSREVATAQVEAHR